MKILHAYCLNYNLGDYALGMGLKSLLRRNLTVDLIGDINIQGQLFDEYYINEVVNKRYDLLVIGGGGIIHGKHWPNGWFWLINQDLIQKIKIPFIVYGIGNNYWESEGGIPERTILHLKETKKQSSFFSVRNDGSHSRLLAQTGIDASVAPDPGFHVNLIEDFYRIEKKPYVIIQLANDKPEYRFGNDVSKLQTFVNNMKEITKKLSKKYTVVFAPHVIDDIKISEEISSGIPNTYVWNFSDYAFDRSDRAVGFYKYAEFVLAMRGHGQIVPISFNTPVIAIENHPKHRGLMENLNLLDFSISINDDEFVNNMNLKIEQIESQRSELLDKYKNINARLLSDSNNAFDVIKKNIY